jgi:hypothetical protein
MSPYDKVRNARNQLGFVLRLSEAVEQNRIGTTNFVTELRMLEEGTDKELVVFKQAPTEADLGDFTYNLLVTALGTLAVSMDTALEAHFGGRGASLSSEVEDAWALIYMLRCATAHDPLEPKWVVTKAKYKRTLSIPSIHMAGDLSTLDGKPVQFGHFGGWVGLFRLTEFVMNLLDPQHGSANR